MSIDRRKKGCPNQSCDMHKKKIRQKASVNYCPKCGEKLVFVCAKCFREIENTSPSHRICSRCQADADDRKDKIIGAVKGFATPIAGAVVLAVQQDAIKGAVGVAKKATKEVAKAAAQIVKH